MVLVNDVKFACQACIKGHRSSGCNHADRPLFEIRRKGRPTTQCDDCRDLRKTRKLHVKCVCDGRRDPDKTVGPVLIQSLSPSLAMNGRKAGRKIPLIPTLPNGLKDVDELSNKVPSVISEDSVDRKPDLDEIAQSVELPSSSTSVTPPASSSAVPLRPCCARKNKAHTKSLSLVGPFAGLDVNEETLASTSSVTAEQLTASTSSLGLSLPSSSSTLSPDSHSQLPQPLMMACLCGPNCVCLDCTFHPRSNSFSGMSAADDSDVVMHGLGCPPNCPSCVDCMGGAAWPVLSIDPRELSGRPGDLSRTMQGSSISMPLELADFDRHGGSLGLDLSLSASSWDWKMDDLEEYDDDMDAEGSPDPDYCPLPSVSDSLDPSLATPGPSIGTLSKGISLRDLSSSKRVPDGRISKDSGACCTDNRCGVGGSKAQACCAGRVSRAPVTVNRNTSSKLRL